MSIYNYTIAVIMRFYKTMYTIYSFPSGFVLLYILVVPTVVMVLVFMVVHSSGCDSDPSRCCYLVVRVVVVAVCKCTVVQWPNSILSWTTHNDLPFLITKFLSTVASPAW